MREVKTGSQFRKDLKRYRNDSIKLEKLYDLSVNTPVFRQVMIA